MDPKIKMGAASLPDDVVAHILMFVLEGRFCHSDENGSNYTKLCCVCKRWNKILSTRIFFQRFRPSYISREDLICLADIAMEADRYDEMIKMISLAFMKQAQSSLHDRQVLSRSIGRCFSDKRMAIRCLRPQLEKMETSSHQASLCKAYISTIQLEIEKDYKLVSRVLNHCLTSQHTTDEAKVSFYTMIGDLNRYMIDAFDFPHTKKYTELGLEALQKGHELAKAVLPPTHRSRLGIAVKYADYIFDIFHKGAQAMSIAKSEFDEAVKYIDTVGEEDYRETTLLMSLLRDNKTLWTSEAPEEEDEN